MRQDSNYYQLDTTKLREKGVKKKIIIKCVMNVVMNDTATLKRVMPGHEGVVNSLCIQPSNSVTTKAHTVIHPAYKQYAVEVFTGPST